MEPGNKSKHLGKAQAVRESVQTAVALREKINLSRCECEYSLQLRSLFHNFKWLFCFSNVGLCEALIHSQCITRCRLTLASSQFGKNTEQNSGRISSDQLRWLAENQFSNLKTMQIQKQKVKLYVVISSCCQTVHPSCNQVICTKLTLHKQRKHCCLLIAIMNTVKALNKNIWSCFLDRLVLMHWWWQALIRLRSKV